MLSWLENLGAATKDDIQTANEYVDVTLDKLREDPEISKHLDPLKMPDIEEDKYKIRNMQIRGLLSLYRLGDCSLSYKRDTLNVVARVAVKDVSITLDYKAKAWLTWINGEGEVKVDNIAVKLDFSNTDGMSHLNSFKVIHLGDYRVKRLTGLSFVLNWLLRIIANTIAHNSRQNIINALENEAGRALGNLLNKNKIPLL